MNAPTDAAAERAEKSEKKDAADERIASLEERLEKALGVIGDLQARAAAAPPPIDDYVTAQLDPDRQQNQPITRTIKELRAYDGPLYVRHNDPQRQFSCHQQLGEHRVDFDLGPAGSPDSIGYLPKLALEIRGVQRAIMRKVITVSTDDAMEDEIMLAMGQHLHASEDQLASLMAPLQPGNNERDIVTKPCLICGEYVVDPMTGEQSHVIRGGQVFQRYADYKAGRPPLCQMHESQEHMYEGTLHEDPQTGIRDWVFQIRTTVGAPQPGVDPGMPNYHVQGDDARPKVRRVGV